ncbi:fra a 1-associated protein [Aristolochia californica]|uniref:fra a 1-associated protein n=1 Tax=Aristolochia californica TaxID=171875 RepID=UPI0035DDBD94
MGWVWRDDEMDEPRAGISDRGFGDIGELESSDTSSDHRCSMKKVVQSRCKVEEVEPGKFVNKCEKTEKLLRRCAGRPAEVVESITEYTEDDITDSMVRGSFAYKSTPSMDGFPFPGLQNDIEVFEHNLSGGFSRFMEGFMEAADEMRNGLFQAFGIPSIFERQSPHDGLRSSDGIFGNEAPPKQKDESDYAEYAGKVQDV